MYRYAPIALVLCGLLVTAGCGKKGASVKVYPVKGKVIYNDKPLAGATVSYVMPDNPDAPRSSGLTDAEGQFSLNTYVSVREVLVGAPPGDYTVVVVKLAPEKGAGSEDEMSKMESMSPEERAVAMTKMMNQNLPEQGKKPAPPKSEVPASYTKASTSVLKATVVSGENPAAEFKLHD